ncbi:MAG: S-layer homology domain-containing protein [Oscillospiraceae bacterium]
MNTVSALYPTTTDKNTTECLKRDGTQGWVNYDGYSDIAFQPGIWYVMPVTRADHMQFVGGIANKSIIETHLFYRNLMDDIYSTYRTVQPTETPFPFTDVPESRWSYPYIKELYDAGVVSGTSATTFEPTANVTRAQFVTMLAGLQGADVSAYTSGKFSDVPADAWYAPYVNWAAENGVVYGVSDTAFAPDAEISRQDMAAMLYRYAGQFGIQLGTGNPAITFTDEADIADYALPAVEALQRAGVISGMPDGSFRPRDTATREQACVMLCLL